MATRYARLVEFPSEPDRQEGQVFEVLCQDNSGTYVLPFVCCWHDGAWWNESKSQRIEARVVGWRGQRPKPKA
jgi:hypothetical protein